MQEHSVDLQQLYLEFLLNDRELWTRCSGITDIQYFDQSLRPAVKFIQKHTDEYGEMPTQEQITATTGIDLKDIDITDDHKRWFIDEYEKFCKFKAMENAILKGADMLQKKEYGGVEKLVKEAMDVGIAKDLGVSFWENQAEQLQKIKDNRGQNSTGWETVDKILYGGFNPGELNIFAGGSGSGKSLFMQNMAYNWSMAGKNVVYISLELSEELCNMRMFAMATDKSTKDVMKNSDDVAMELGMKKKAHKPGELQVIQMKNGSTVNDIKAYIKEYQIQKNIKVDALFVDYLDLMRPVTVKVNVSDQFIKDKYVSEELRNLAIELNILFVTASQLNRSSVDEPELDHSHIAGGISKINTADNLIGIFSSRAMRERGRVQIQFMKTRSSSGVGTKADLGYSMDTLRIFDLDEDERDSEGAVSVQSVYQQIKSSGPVIERGKVTETDPATAAVSNTDRLATLLRRRE